MKGHGEYVVVYDISSNTERSKVDKALKSFGFRVQESVFECLLDSKGKTMMLRKLQRLNVRTGFIRVYRLDGSFTKVTLGEIEKVNGIDEGQAYII